MQIILNNRVEKFDDTLQLSLKDLLNHKNYTYKLLIIKVNGNNINKEDYEKTLLKEGDKVSVLHLMAGG